MKHLLKIASVFLLAGVIYGSPVLDLSPGSGLVTGGPGATVGWGFTITNDTPYWLVFDNSAFCGPGGDPFLNSCTSPYDGITNFGPSLGTYTDYIATQFTFIAPGTMTVPSSLSEGFDATAMTGVGAYTIDLTAPLYSTDPADPSTEMSNLFVQYEEYTGNPFTTGIQVPGTGEFELSAPVEVEVTPEPSTFVLFGAGLLLAASRRMAAKR